MGSIGQRHTCLCSSYSLTGSCKFSPRVNITLSVIFSPFVFFCQFYYFLLHQYKLERELEGRRARTTVLRLLKSKMKQEMKRNEMSNKKKDVDKSSSAKAKAMNCNITICIWLVTFDLSYSPCFSFLMYCLCLLCTFQQVKENATKKNFTKSATTQFVSTYNCNSAVLFKYTSQHALALML